MTLHPLSVQLARAGKRLEPVFIVGEARSGSTLLYRLLQQQPAFGPASPQLAESQFATHLLSGSDLDAQHCWKLRNYLMDDAAAWVRFKQAAAPLLAARSAVLRVRPGVYQHPRAGRMVGVAQLARVYLAVAAEVRAPVRLIEKSPFHTPYTGHLLDWFPGARILYIHRHPVDVLTSYWRRARLDKRRAGWAEIAVADFARDYAQRSAIAIGWRDRRPDAVRLVSYKSLVTDPTATIASLCAFTGSPFDAAAVAAPEARRASPDPLTWSEVTATSKDWRDYISDEQVADLEIRVGDALDALGHPRYARSIPDEQII